MMREKNLERHESTGQVILYKNNLEVRLEKDTVWLTQKQMSELFDTDRTVISKHLRNIYSSGELEEKSNVQKMHIANSDKPVTFYTVLRRTIKNQNTKN
ncbi:MAG: hypothetical protein ABFD50_03170 [Smithella sp.]